MKVRVIDFETLGMPEDEPRGICEAGWVDVTSDGVIGRINAVMVNPGHAIPPTAMAIHHIRDEDVRGAADPTTACAALMDGMEPGDVFAAHNCAFEQAFFGGGGHRWICTMRAAKHLFPDSPSHSNQVLRYWLGLDANGLVHEAAMPPHRAGPDAYVTAYILARMLTVTSIDELVRLTTAPVILTTIRFGKHRGQKWADLPASYLQWIVDKSDLGADEKHTARHHLARLAA